MSNKKVENSPEKIAVPELKFCQKVEFNPLRDIQEVEDGLAVDITDMLETGVVKDSSGSLDNNNIDDPASIIGLVRDEFAAIDAQRAIKKYGKKSKGVEKAAEAAAATTSPDTKVAD